LSRSQHSEPGGFFVQDLQIVRIRARGGIAIRFRDYPRMPRRFPANRAEYRNRGLAACRIIGLVREMGGEAMSGKRNYWSKMKHSEAMAAVKMMTDEEVGRWFRGWLSGATGDSEAQPQAAIEWRMGFSAGVASFHDAEECSKKQADRVSKRYAKPTAVDPAEESLPEATAVDPVHHGIPRNTNNSTVQYSTVEQRTKNKEQGPAAPSRDEWNVRAAEAFPWWPRWDVDKAFAYWSNENWTREGKRVRSDWRRLMGTWAGKWAKDNPRDVERHTAPIVQENGNRLPSGFRPLGKAPEV